MLGYFGHQVMTAAIGSAASKSATILVKGWNHVAIACPAFGTLLGESTCNVYVEVSKTATTSEFKRLKTMGQYSSNVGIFDWEVPSTTGNWITTCQPAAHFDYLRIHLSTAATDAIDFEVHVHH